MSGKKDETKDAKKDAEKNGKPKAGTPVAGAIPTLPGEAEISGQPPQPPESSAQPPELAAQPPEPPKERRYDVRRGRAADEEAAITEVMIELPLATPPRRNAYVARQINVRLDRDTAVTLDRLYRVLDRENVRLGSGKPLKSRIDAVRWLLERVAEAE